MFGECLSCSVSSRRATCWQATTTQQRRTMTSSGPCPSVSSHSNSLVSSVFSSSLNGGWCFPHTSEPIVFCFPFSNYRFVVWLLWRQEGASELFDSFFLPSWCFVSVSTPSVFVYWLSVFVSVVFSLLQNYKYLKGIEPLAESVFIQTRNRSERLRHLQEE